MKKTHNSKDNYVQGMDWGEGNTSIGSLNNYRQYQYDLIADYIGKDVLEVGCGSSRSFTKLVLKDNTNLNRLLSIEPSRSPFSL